MDEVILSEAETDITYCSVLEMRKNKSSIRRYSSRLKLRTVGIGSQICPDGTSTSKMSVVRRRLREIMRFIRGHYNKRLKLSTSQIKALLSELEETRRNCNGLLGKFHLKDIGFNCDYLKEVLNRYHIKQTSAETYKQTKNAEIVPNNLNLSQLPLEQIYTQNTDLNNCNYSQEVLQTIAKTSKSTHQDFLIYKQENNTEIVPKFLTSIPKEGSISDNCVSPNLLLEYNYNFDLNQLTPLSNVASNVENQQGYDFYIQPINDEEISKIIVCENPKRENTESSAESNDRLNNEEAVNNFSQSGKSVGPIVREHCKIKESCVDQFLEKCLTQERKIEMSKKDLNKSCPSRVDLLTDFEFGFRESSLRNKKKSKNKKTMKEPPLSNRMKYESQCPKLNPIIKNNSNNILDEADRVLNESKLLVESAMIGNAVSNLTQAYLCENSYSPIRLQSYNEDICFDIQDKLFQRNRVPNNSLDCQEKMYCLTKKNIIQIASKLEINYNYLQEAIDSITSDDFDSTKDDSDSVISASQSPVKSRNPKL